MATSQEHAEHQKLEEASEDSPLDPLGEHGPADALLSDSGLPTWERTGFLSLKSPVYSTLLQQPWPTNTPTKIQILTLLKKNKSKCSSKDGSEGVISFIFSISKQSN